MFYFTVYNSNDPARLSAQVVKASLIVNNNQTNV